MRRGACCRQRLRRPFPRRERGRGRGRRRVTTVVMSRWRAAGTDPATRRWTRGPGTAHVCFSMLCTAQRRPRAGADARRDGEGCVDPTKGGRGRGGSGETRRRTHTRVTCLPRKPPRKKLRKIARGRLETISSLLSHGQTPIFSYPIPETSVLETKSQAILVEIL